MNVVQDATILGIQFSILSPTEIRNASVAKITNRDTYINNKPVIGGLFDPRMGTMEPGTICPTDGLDHIKCPGYFGHIELARPVFYIQFLDTVISVIKMVCIRCSKLLIDKHKHQYLCSLPNEKRWRKVHDLCSGVKRCGENDDGCGCIQPVKYKREGIATVIAEWPKLNKEDALPTNMKIPPEMFIKIFSKISDEDVSYMGLSPIWSRPEWMICQVLAVPPPSVRPSVKQDSSQRSEDDLSHLLVQIIKTNKTLMDKMLVKPTPVISQLDDYHTLLQFYIASMIDNKIPNSKPATQRSGRAFKSIKDRLNGKTGRLRGNLMGKRVDFSARSVITPDPNLSICELGVPLKIAKNMTKPVIVNSRNIDALTALVRNGPDNYPGAKLLERVKGEQSIFVSLKYADRTLIKLNEGDVVHRHMMNGDVILFNRQPTLHRMSMMGHKVRVMFKGDTFRMNVGVTKPYNADFDGDEMNLHMPQSLEAETELRHLAAVQYQILSPATNSPIIGIFQDSLIGAYLFTRDKLSFTPLDAMNLINRLKHIDVQIFKDAITNFDLLSLIIPSMTIQQKTGNYNAENPSPNHIISIKNGVYKHGQMDKRVLGGKSSGLIHRIFNDFGHIQSTEFIDNLQYIVNEYMKTHSYSVGISDLHISTESVDEIHAEILDKHKKVMELIAYTHLNKFKNDTGKPNVDEFENQVMQLLNDANKNSGKIGNLALKQGNRFIGMVNSGSKGTDINIAQMVSCLGPQQIEHKRIQYGFEDRTLPHFYKFDDSPGARGFITSSFIKGLTPVEFFFHAMGGRIGLIDTAVKTSTTGYIQRRLVKGLEDCISLYDGTVRNSKNKVMQFKYGDDNIDPAKVESQYIKLCEFKQEQIYSHFHTEFENAALLFDHETFKRYTKQLSSCRERSHKVITSMIQSKDTIIDNVFKFKSDFHVYLPVHFDHIINNIKNQVSSTKSTVIDITPLEVFQLTDLYFEKFIALGAYSPNNLFKVLYEFNLSPKELLLANHMNKSAITLLLENIVLHYKQSLLNPGEMVGIIAAQSIGEPTTQMTLNTFHFAGVSSKSNVTLGVPRIEEILSLSANIKRPSDTIYLKEFEQLNDIRAKEILTMIEYTTLIDITSSASIIYDNAVSEDKELIQMCMDVDAILDGCTVSDKVPSPEVKWVIRLELDVEQMFAKNITMDDVNFALKQQYMNDIDCIYADYNHDQLIVRIKLISKKNKKNLYQDMDHIYRLRNVQDHILNTTLLRGIKNVKNVTLRKIKKVVKENGNYEKKEICVLDTVGTNLMDILGLDYIDYTKTFSNDIKEMEFVLGIEAARESILNELTDVIEFDGSYLNERHKTLLCDRMTNNNLIAISRHGINNDDIGPISKAAFEETPEMLLKAAKFAEFDSACGVSCNVMLGQPGLYGTGAFDLMADMEKFKESIHKEEKIQEDVYSNTCVNIEIKHNLGNIVHTSVYEEIDDSYQIEL
jgi:DNA-directed RNA polymerase II subunit RPB1